MLFTALAACIIIISQRHYNAIIISHFQYKRLASFSAGNVVCDDDYYYYYYYYQQYLISVIKNYSVFAILKVHARWKLMTQEWIITEEGK